MGVPAAPRSTKTFLEPADVALLEANAVAKNPRTGELAPCLRDMLLIRLLFRNGVRVGEAVGVAIDDVFLNRQELRILHLKERLRLYCPGCGHKLGRNHSYCPGCGREVTQAEQRLQQMRRQRMLPLDRDTVQMLRHYIKGGGPVMRNGRLMLLGMTTSRAWQVVRDAARRAGLGPLLNPETGRQRGVSPHRLRDAFATHAAGVDDSPEGVKLLQEQLGHRSVDQTMRYVKVAGDKRKQWFDKLWEEER